MAQQKPEYEEIEDFNEYIVELVEKYPEMFPGANAEEYSSNIKAFGLINKPFKDGKDPVERIYGIADPVRKVCEVSYIVSVYQEVWDAMSEKHRAALVMSALRRIPTDATSEGKLTPLDYKDDGAMVRTLGVDYLDRDDIPDLLNDDVEWVVK